MEDGKRTCETCRYYVKGTIDDGSICTCIRSRFYGEIMEDKDLCKEWKGAKDDKGGA